MQLKVPFAETSIGDRAISSEAMLVKATAGPLPWSLALEALQRQSQCWLPLKLALAEHGAPQILTEAPRLRSRRESEARAAEILDAGLAWLGGKSAVVRKRTVTPCSRSCSAKAGGERVTPRVIPTTRPPLNSGPQTSKVIASNDGLEACATTSPGPRAM